MCIVFDTHKHVHIIRHVPGYRHWWIVYEYSWRISYTGAGEALQRSLRDCFTKIKEFIMKIQHKIKSVVKCNEFCLSKYKYTFSCVLEDTIFMTQQWPSPAGASWQFQLLKITIEDQNLFLSATSGITAINNAGEILSRWCSFEQVYKGVKFNRCEHSWRLAIPCRRVMIMTSS